MTGQEERSLVARLRLNSWIIFLAMTMAALTGLPAEVAWGVIIGNLIVTVNVMFLKRAVYRTLDAGRVKPTRVLPKFYLCFAATVLILFVLISQQLVHSLGLLLGLSSFCVNVFLIMVQEMGKTLYKYFSKEAV